MFSPQCRLFHYHTKSVVVVCTFLITPWAQIILRGLALPIFRNSLVKSAIIIVFIPINITVHCSLFHEQETWLKQVSDFESQTFFAWAWPVVKWSTVHWCHSWTGNEDVSLTHTHPATYIESEIVFVFWGISQLLVVQAVSLGIIFPVLSRGFSTHGQNILQLYVVTHQKFW